MMKGWWNSPVAFLLLTIVLTVGIYSNAYHNPFQYDDFHSIVNNPHIWDLKKIPTYFISTDTSSAFGPLQNMYRPVLMTTYALNYHWGGPKPEGYRIVNLALHLLCILLVYVIAIRLFQNTRIGLIASLLWAAHPFQSEVVNYISARSSGMATTFYLLTVSLFLIIRDPKWRTRTLWVQGGLYLTFLVSFCLAMLTKEISLTLPAILILADLLLMNTQSLPQSAQPTQTDAGGFFSVNKGTVRALLVNSWIYLPFILFTLYFMARIDFVGVLKNLRIAPLALQVQILAQTPWLYFVPGGLAAHHEFSGTTILYDPTVTVSFLVLSGLLLYGLYCAFSVRPPLRVLAFLILWFFITSLPTTLVPLNVAFMEHRGYLSGVGLILLLAAAADRLWLLLKGISPRPARYAAYFLGITIVIVLANGTWNRNPVWQDAIHLWSDAVEKNPTAMLPRLFLGQAYQRAGDLEKSLGLYMKIISEDPHCKNLHPCTYAHFRIGEIYHEQDRLAEAIEKYQEAIRRSPEGYVLRYLANYKMGTAYQRLGKSERAAQAYQEALRRNPTSHAAHFALGSVYEAQKHYDLARKEYEASLRLSPAFHTARLRLASVLLRQGLLTPAAREYETVLAAEPENGPAHRALGYIHENQGNLDQAVHHYQRAIEAGSDDPGFRYHLGLLYVKTGNRQLARQHWENALVQAPDFLEARFNLAKLLQQEGLPQEARTQYQKLKALIQPGSEYEALGRQVETELRTLEKNTRR